MKTDFVVFTILEGKDLSTEKQKGVVSGDQYLFAGDRVELS
jgi:hypothetical protein